ncbi:metallophosphoesterase family protein [Krasilnikovia cinnamomea]|nr:metallophosphoesterase [Krasilnikovia cinnamomea]
MNHLWLRRRGGRATLLAVLAAVVLVPTVASAAVVTVRAAAPGRTAAAQPLSTSEGQLIAIVGDISCAPTNPVYRGGEGSPAGCRQDSVAAQLAGRRLHAFLPLGDLQYEDGRLDEFINVYDQFFGPYKAISRPVPGNHEYKTPSGQGYYEYFGAAAHKDTPYGVPGSYSYDVGSWHLIAINSNLCAPITPCTDTSPMIRWLKDDLAAHPNRCTLAYWHHPLYSLGHHGAYAPMTPVWNTLLDNGVDVVMTAHDHNYQRFTPLGRATAIDNSTMVAPTAVPESQGMRSWIVGTGGANNYGLDDHPDVEQVTESKYADTSAALFGVLFMRLRDGGYAWDFQQAQPATVPFSDSGVGTCR